MNIKVNTRAVVADALARGIDAGYDKAFKHTDKPSADAIKDSIEQYVWDALNEYVKFEDCDSF